MALNKSKLAYEQEYEVLDQALESVSGIRFPYPTRSDAHAYQVRLNYARQMDREESHSRLDPADPMFGKSVYDCLRTSLKHEGSKWWIYISVGRKPEGIEEIPVDAQSSGS